MVLRCVGDGNYGTLADEFIEAMSTTIEYRALAKFPNRDSTDKDHR